MRRKIFFAWPDNAPVGDVPQSKIRTRVRILFFEVEWSNPRLQALCSAQSRKDVPCGGYTRSPCQLRLLMRSRGSRRILDDQRRANQIVRLAMQTSLPRSGGDRVWR
jgi:hypothetical protein